MLSRSFLAPFMDSESTFKVFVFPDWIWQKEYWRGEPDGKWQAEFFGGVEVQ